MSQPSPSYDVFLSYSHADEDFVWNWLAPKLKAEGISVCSDRESFDIGAPALINMERAVAASRHTLLVLSPDWVAGQWTAYESLLVQTADPGGLLQRTLPALLRPCALPARIAMLTYADLTGKVDREREFARIVRAIRGNRSLPEGGGGEPGAGPPSKPPVSPAGPPPAGGISIGNLDAVNVSLGDMTVDQRGAHFDRPGAPGEPDDSQAEHDDPELREAVAAKRRQLRKARRFRSHLQAQLAGLGAGTRRAEVESEIEETEALIEEIEREIDGLMGR